eukprot:12401966-Karenia_brevis.AAC.1
MRTELLTTYEDGQPKYTSTGTTDPGPVNPDALCASSNVTPGLGVGPGEEDVAPSFTDGNKSRICMGDSKQPQ